MNTRLSLTLTALLAAVSCLAPSTLAAKEGVTVAITVDITDVSDPENVLRGLTPDHELTGTYTFNPDAEDAVPDREDLAFYYHKVPPYGMTLTDPLDNKYEIGAGEEAMYIQVGNGVPPDGDMFRVGAFDTDVTLNEVPCAVHGVLEWYLSDSDGLAFVDDKQPQGAPDLLPWEVNELFFDCGDKTWNLLVLGTVTFAEVVNEDPLEQLLAVLDEMAEAGTALDAKQENGLFQKIHQVSVKVASNRTYQACQELQAFICQVEALSDQFASTVTAEELLALAREVVASIPCPEDFAQCPVLRRAPSSGL